jgi:hypothetical protein
VATINWGDGQLSAGTILADPDTGRFDVVGETTYAEQGQYPVTIAIADRSGIIATIPTTATVADAPLSAAGVPVKAIRGEVFTGLVATFTDANPGGQVSDFTATIAWGDGQTSAGTITADPLLAGQFNVVGTVVYADAGSFPVTVSIADVGGATATARTTAEVTALPEAAGTSSVAQAGVPFSTVVATIVDDSLDAQPGDYTAAIDWGDGHTSPGLVTLDPEGAGRFRVLGSTAYAREGTYPVAVALARQDGFRTTVQSTVEVSPAPAAPPVVLAGLPVAARQREPVTSVVAVFRGSDPVATAGAFDATIAWGDGSVSAGTVIAGPAGTNTFAVLGSHTYLDAGLFPTSISIRPVGGVLVTADSTALVTGSVLTPPGIGPATHGSEPTPPVAVPAAPFTQEDGSGGGGRAGGGEGAAPVGHRGPAADPMDAVLITATPGLPIFTIAAESPGSFEERTALRPEVAARTPRTDLPWWWGSDGYDRPVDDFWPWLWVTPPADEEVVEPSAEEVDRFWPWLLSVAAAADRAVGEAGKEAEESWSCLGEEDASGTFLAPLPGIPPAQFDQAARAQAVDAIFAECLLIDGSGGAVTLAVDETAVLSPWDTAAPFGAAAAGLLHAACSLWWNRSRNGKEKKRRGRPDAAPGRA